MNIDMMVFLLNPQIRHLLKMFLFDSLINYPCCMIQWNTVIIIYRFTNGNDLRSESFSNAMIDPYSVYRNLENQLKLSSPS